jgi:hypothetical protein
VANPNGGGVSAGREAGNLRACFKNIKVEKLRKTKPGGAVTPRSSSRIAVEASPWTIAAAAMKPAVDRGGHDECGHANES